ncbi:MAG: hypothetical protein V2A63_01460 [Patescibacteria group bacterium]
MFFLPNRIVFQQLDQLHPDSKIGPQSRGEARPVLLNQCVQKNKEDGLLDKAKRFLFGDTKSELDKLQNKIVLPTNLADNLATTTAYLRERQQETKDPEARRALEQEIVYMEMVEQARQFVVSDYAALSKIQNKLLAANLLKKEDLASLNKNLILVKNKLLGGDKNNPGALEQQLAAYPGMCKTGRRSDYRELTKTVHGLVFQMAEQIIVVRQKTLERAQENYSGQFTNTELSHSDFEKNGRILQAEINAFYNQTLGFLGSELQILAAQNKLQEGKPESTQAKFQDRNPLKIDTSLMRARQEAITKTLLGIAAGNRVFLKNVEGLRNPSIFKNPKDVITRKLEGVNDKMQKMILPEFVQTLVQKFQLNPEEIRTVQKIFDKFFAENQPNLDKFSRLVKRLEDPNDIPRLIRQGTPKSAAEINKFLQEFAVARETVLTGTQKLFEELINNNIDHRFMKELFRKLKYLVVPAGIAAGAVGWLIYKLLKRVGRAAPKAILSIFARCPIVIIGDPNDYLLYGHTKGRKPPVI